MSRRLLLMLAAAPLLLGASGETGALAIRWVDLRPPAQPATAAGAAPASPLEQTLTQDLAGKQIELAGYLLPVDREDDLVYQFMLVPLTGACAHVPPPPPNQIVLVTPATPYRASELYEPVIVTGVLKPGIEQSQFFLLDGVVVVTSGYSIGRARVAHAADVPDGMAGPAATPWKFLKQ